MINVLTEPKGESYKALLDLAFSKCTEFILVERHQNQLNEKGSKILKMLKSELVDIEVDEQWPGTRLTGHFANIYVFKTSDLAKKVVMENTSSLYSWISPDYPEDLIFYKTKGEVWLLSTSHEQTCDIYETDQSILDRLLEIGVDCKMD